MKKLLKASLLFAAVFFIQFSHAQSASATALTWDGEGADTNWSTCENWTTDTCPTTGDNVTFNGTSTKDSTIDASYTTGVTNFTINTGYTGTVTQARSFTVSRDTLINAGNFVADTSTLTFTGLFTLSSGNFTASSGTTNFGNSFVHTDGGTFSHNNGTIKAIGTTDATFSLAGSETFYNFESAKNDGYTLVIDSGDSIIVANTATLTDGFLQTGIFNAKGTLSVADTFDFGTVNLQFSGTGPQTLTLPSGRTSSWDLGSLTINKASGTLYLGSNVLLDCGGASCATTLTQGTFDPSGYTFQTNDFILTNGTLVGQSGTLDINDDLTINGGTFNASSNTTYVGGDFTHTGAGTFNHNSGTIEFDGVNEVNMDVNSTETFNNYRFNKDGWTQSLDNSDTLIIVGTLNLTDGRCVSGAFEPQGDVTVGAGFDYCNSRINFTGNNTQHFTLGVASILDGDMSINKTAGSVVQSGLLTMNDVRQDLLVVEGTYDLNGSNLTVSGVDGTFVIQDGGTLELEGGETLTLNGGAPSLLSGSTVTYSGSSGPYTLQDYPYKSLRINGGSTTVFILPTNESLTENLTISAGILSLNDKDLTVTGTFSNLGTLQLQGTETVSLTNDTNSGTVKFIGDNDDAADNFNLPAWTFFSLDIDMDDATDSITAPAGTTTLNGNFSLNSGLFDANNGTVNLNGSNQQLSGAITFFNLTKTTATSVTLTLPAGVTITIEGDLTLSGELGEALLLRSSTNGIQASIAPQGEVTVDYVNVQDSLNLSDPIVCPNTCVNSLNNINWVFTDPNITVSAISGNTSEAGIAATFTIVLDTAISADVTINISSSDTTEGTVDVDSVVFTDANWNTPQTVTVTGIDDATDDGDVPYTIVIGAADSSDLNYDSLDPTDLSLSNLDNDETVRTGGGSGGSIGIHQQTASSSTTSAQFDVPNHWAETYLEDVLNNDFIMNVADVNETFVDVLSNFFESPDESVSRSEALSFLMVQSGININDLPLTQSAPLFTDVPSSREDFDFIQYAKENDYVNGYDDGTFRPDQILNRVEALKLALTFYNAESKVPSTLRGNELLEFYNLSANPFNDVDLDAWYAPYVLSAYDSGVVIGYTDGSFKPNQSISYAEILKISSLIQTKTFLLGFFRK